MRIIDPLDKALRVLRTLQYPPHLQPNEDETAYRVSSGAFIPGTDDTISVDLEESLIAAGLKVDSRYGCLVRSVAMVAHTVTEYENQGFSVRHDPIPNENDHHGAVGTSKRNNALRKAARHMADNSTFVVPIDYAEALRLGAPDLKNRIT